MDIWTACEVLAVKREGGEGFLPIEKKNNWKYIIVRIVEYKGLALKLEKK